MSYPEDPLDDELGQTVSVLERSIIEMPERHLQLVVIGDGTFAMHPLPSEGAIMVGRSRACGITIDHKSMSRRHALLRVGERITVEDLASRNGTRVAGKRLMPHEPVSIAVGEPFRLGKVAVLVQHHAEAERGRRLYSGADFRARVEEECARARRSNGSFAVLRIEIGSHRAHQPPPDSFVEAVLVDVLRASDILGKLPPRDYAALLLDMTAAAAETAARRLEAKLAERGVPTQMRVAAWPRDGTTTDELLARVQPAERAPRNNLEIVVGDPQMRELHRLIAQVAPTNIGVLLLGETGVGKEVFARTVHRASSRAGGPFVDLNCATLTESLLESELFGHEKGSFTNAHASKPGLIESAEGGTVFLDEIGDMPLATQAKLLRVIEDAQVRRVGALKSRPIDVRFVAATNVNLESAVERGTFRRDLFFRLNGITLLIPPLRQRTAEIEPLAQAFIRRAAHMDGRAAYVPTLSVEALAVLRVYRWPGNVRELKHVIERAVALCGKGPIGVEHLPREVVTNQGPELAGPVPDDNGARELGPPDPELGPRPLRKGVEEQQWILAALERAGGNQTVAARLLGISRRTLVNRLNEYGELPRPRKDRRSDS